MNKRLNRIIVRLIWTLTALVAVCQTNAQIAQTKMIDGQTSNPTEYIDLDITKLRQSLSTVPDELDKSPISYQHTLPIKTLQDVQYSIRKSNILEGSLKKANPDVQSYLIDGSNGSTGRMTLNSKGLTLVLYLDNSQIFIEPVGENRHRIEYGADTQSYHCGFLDEKEVREILQKAGSAVNTGSTLRKYVIAFATTAEFYSAAGGSLSAVNNEITSLLTGLNAIYERELTIRFILANNNNNVVSSTDYASVSGGLTTGNLSSAQTVINSGIGSSSYDIGHVLHHLNGGGGYSGSGVARLQATCGNNVKAMGWSGFTVTAPLSFKLGLLAHEIGHQFGANHTFYGTAGSCGLTNQRAPNHAYEPGSGNTVMSYEGSCSSHNISPYVATIYFHVHSLEQILSFVNSSADCFDPESTGNTIPDVTAPADFTIPKNTPFEVMGMVSDPDQDNLTFIWEECDTDGSSGGAPNSAANSTTAPLFRSFDPTSSGIIRTFPQHSDLLNNTQTQGEILPNVARNIKLRLTARDNRSGGGGTKCDEVDVTVHNSGPFTVTSPNTAVTWNAGSNYTVSWNHGGSNSYCGTVNILLSVDGGYSYPYELASGVSNNGSRTINLPSSVSDTDQARIRVECAAYDKATFFDVSNVDFTVNSSCSAFQSQLLPVIHYALDKDDPDLALSLSYVPGTEATDISRTITSNSSTMRLSIYSSSARTGCYQTSSTSFRHEMVQLTPSVSGTYQFNVDYSNGGGFGIISIFDGAPSSANPCSSFMGSTGWLQSGLVYTNGSLSVNLNGGQTYYMAMYNLGSLPKTTVVNISGSGGIFESGSMPGGFDYTYILIDQTNGMINKASSNSNFSGTNPGRYEVRGVSYATGGTSPSSWVGQSFSNAVASGSCALPSTNFGSLHVTGASSDCDVNTLTLPSVSAGTYDDAMNISSTATVGSSPVTFMAENEIILGLNFEVVAGSLFTAEISPCPASVKEDSSPKK